MNAPNPDEASSDALSAQGLTASHFLLDVRLLRQRVPSFDAYPFNLPAVRHLDTLALHPRVTFLVGENGTGKSTLLEGIAVAMGLNPEGGSRNFNFETRPSHSQLHSFLDLRRGVARPSDRYFLRAESYYNLATEIERLDAAAPPSEQSPPIIQSYGERSLHEQSHGESFFALFQNRFFGHGFYLMDEPEAALSPTRQLSFLSILHDQVRSGSQFIIATHSPIIMAYSDAWIYVLGQGAPTRTAYHLTEHYKVTRDFLTHTQQMLSVLMQSDQTASGPHSGPPKSGMKTEREGIEPSSPA